MGIKMALSRLGRGMVDVMHCFKAVLDNPTGIQSNTSLRNHFLILTKGIFSQQYASDETVLST